MGHELSVHHSPTPPHCPALLIVSPLTSQFLRYKGSLLLALLLVCESWKPGVATQSRNVLDKLPEETLTTDDLLWSLLKTEAPGL